MRALAVLVGLGLVFGPISAFAEDVTQVNLTDAGPDRPLPIGSSFYLAGSAAPTTRSVQAIIVRTGHPFLLWPNHQSCSALSAHLVVDAPAAKPLAPGRIPASTAFPSATAHRDDDAFASAAWVRGDATGTQAFKLLVSADTGFFQAGFTYCLFLVEGRALVDDQHIAAALEELGEATAKCRIAQGECDERHRDDCQAKADRCATDAENHYDEVVTKLLGGAGDAAKATRAAATAEIGHARTFHLAAARLAQSPPVFARPYGLGQPPRWRRIDGSGDDDDGIAVYLANRLTVTPGGLLPAPLPRPQVGGPAGAGLRLVRAWRAWLTGPPPRARVAKYAPDATYEVTQLQILENGVDIRVAGDAITSAQPAKPLPAKTSNVQIRPDVTLRDLLLLADDRIVVGTKEVALAALRARMDKLTLALPPEDAQLLAGAFAKLDALATAIATIRQVSQDPDRSSDDAPAVVAGQLVRWLQVHQGSTDADRGVLETEKNQLGAIVEAHRDWEALRSSLSFTTQNVAARMVATSTFRFDQRSWLFTYLTPIVGYAALEDSFTTFYTGIQLHFVPNPVNEPQWSNGASDFARLAALELAVSPNTGNFGPDNRYTGIDSIPPIFIGAALHPFPYTSLSIGQVLLKRRASALPAEKPAFTHEWYFGLNVQANIPDLVHTLVTPATTTAVEKR